MGRYGLSGLPDAVWRRVDGGRGMSSVLDCERDWDDDTTRGVAVDGDVAVSRVTSDDVIVRHDRVAVGPARPSRPALLCPEGTGNK